MGDEADDDTDLEPSDAMEAEALSQIEKELFMFGSGGSRKNNENPL